MKWDKYQNLTLLYSFVTAANCSSKASGICFADIQNPMAIYAKVKQIHETAN